MKKILFILFVLILSFSTYGQLLVGVTAAVSGQATAVDDELFPVLSNFYVDDTNTDRVYFDSSEIITMGIDGDVGFEVTDKTISSATLNTGSTTGHYFTVSSAFDFWDNNTIRYEGGSGLMDAENNGLNNFTLQYIVNNIDEPDASTIRYAASTTQGTGDGLSEANAWSYSTAGTSATSGMTVMMLAGTTSGTMTISNDGTSTSPIKFIGYNNAAKDVNRTRTVGMTFDATIMPYFLNGSSSDAINMDNRSYVIFRNIQIEGYSDECINAAHLFNSVIDNVYMKDAFTGINPWGVANNNIRVLNSYVQDVTGIGIFINNKHHLIDNCWAVSTFSVGMDYYIGIGGGFDGVSNIIRNCYAERFPTDSHTGHGTIFKADEHYNGYNVDYSLMEDNTVVNMGQGFTFQHKTTRWNVVRNCRAEMKNSSNASNLITIRDDANYNIVEDCYADGVHQGVQFVMNGLENEGIQAGGHHNKIINTIFDDCTYAININNGWNGTALESTYNEFLNCTFYGATKLIANSLVAFGSTNEFINCIFDSVPSYDASPSFSYSNFYTSFSTPSGTGNVSYNPEFTDVDRGGFQLSTNTPSQVYNGGTDVGVYYDKKGMERKSSYSMGADEWNEGEPFFTKQYNESIYAKTILIEPYNSGNSAHKLISTVGDWSDINSGTYTHFYVEAGDYSSVSASGRVTLTANGTASAKRYISLYNSNDTHPAKLNTSELAKIGFDIQGDYWVIDRMYYGDRFDTTIVTQIVGGSNNIINRYFQDNVDGATVSIYPDSDNNLIQNCRVQNTTFRILPDRAMFNITDNDLDNQSAKNNVFVQNETYNVVDGFQTVREGTAQSIDFNCEGTIVDANHFYIDDTFYTDGAGNHDVNGAYAYAENAIDLKSGSYNAANPIIITNNVMWGFKQSDQTNSNLNDNGVAIIIHAEVPNLIFDNNLIFSSDVGIGVSDVNNNYILLDSEITNNIIKDISESSCYVYDSDGVTITGNLLKDVSTITGNGWNLQNLNVSSPYTYIFQDNLTVNSTGNSIAGTTNLTLTKGNNGWYSAPTNSTIHDASDTDYGSDPTVNYNDINFTTDRFTSSPQTITIQKVAK